MGYQESCIYTDNSSDIKKIIDMFKKYDMRCEDDKYARCYAKITLKKDIEGFKKGTQFLYMYGDRFAQKNIEGIYNIDKEEDFKKYSSEELDIINRTKVVFKEEFCDYNILDDREISDINILSIKALEVDDIYIKKAKEFLDKVCIKDEKTKEIKFIHKIYKNKEFLDFRNNLINVCNDMNIKLNISEQFIPSMQDTYNKVYSIEGLTDIISFEYHKTPHLNHLGSIIQPDDSSDVRALSRIFRDIGVK